MAIYLPEKTICKLCGEIIKASDRTVMCPPFSANKLDKLYFFSDGVFHLQCFNSNPLAVEVTNRIVQSKELTKAKLCVVCREVITEPDNYFTLGHLTDDKNHLLNKYNYTQIHRSCIGNWVDRNKVLSALRRLENSGAWSGIGLEWLLTTLQAYSDFHSDE